MTLPDLLAELKRRGITLRPEGTDAIRYRAPKGAMTDELRAAIRQHKAELLRLLRERVAPELSSPLSAQGVTGPEEDCDSPAPPPARILSAPPAEAVNEYLRAVGARPRREEGRGVFAPALGPDGCCTNCGGDRWWLSWWNLLSCERCAPPPEPDRVRRRMGGPEALRLGNLRRGGETNA